MRFRNGKAQRIGGVTSVITPTNVPYFMLPYSSGTTPYVFYMGLTKAYVHTGAAETEVTRTNLPASVAISTITYTALLIFITTTGAHGLSTGDVITTYGCAPSHLNRVQQTIGVLSATEFTIPSNTSTAGTATTIGAYSVVDMAGAATVNFTGAVNDRLTGGNFNGVVFVNSPKDGLFYYDQAITNKLHQFPDTQYLALFGRSFKNYVFQGGQTISSVLYRHRLAWSAAAEPGTVPISWTPAATNDAGFVDLVSDGEMVDAMEWGENLIVYKRDARFRVSYIGGTFVFDTDLISGNHKDDGMLSQNCGANTPKGQVFLTDGKDVRIHQGGESVSIANGRVHEWLRTNMDPTYEVRSFLSVNPLKNEVWVCFPTTGNTLCNKALIWNWEDDAWGEADLSNVTAATAGEFPAAIATSPRMLLANSTPKIGLVDSGTTYFTASYTSMLERTGMDFDDPSWKTLHASMPLFDASSNFTASIYHGSSPTQDGTVTYSAAQTYTHNTTRRVTAFANSGPYLAWKMTTTAADTPALRSIRFDINIDGTD
jgi:hypothetical protein